MTSASGVLLWSARYDAFGKATVESAQITNNLRFPGQYYDAETGLHYNYHRYYDPRVGRYITRDPIGLIGGLNTYGYALMNPLWYFDNFGLSPLDADAIAEFYGVKKRGRRPNFYLLPNCNPDLDSHTENVRRTGNFAYTRKTENWITLALPIGGHVTYSEIWSTTLYWQEFSKFELVVREESYVVKCQRDCGATDEYRAYWEELSLERVGDGVEWWAGELKRHEGPVTGPFPNPKRPRSWM